MPILAYNEMLSLFRAFTPVPIPLSKADNWHIHPDKIAEEAARGTGIILTSNPRNPTGEVVTNPQLSEIQDMARDKGTIIFDEFYGGYNYTTGGDGQVISAAENVIDVNDDDVIIIDGLTKRFRLPGWRVAWLVGPKAFISALGSCGSYLDGGTNVPFQQAAVPMLEPNLVRTEMRALQKHFMKKRDFVMDRLREIGFTEQQVPEATFYIWLDLSGMPASISDGLTFFEACLREKVTVVPGIFFDLNPSKRRDLAYSTCQQYVRLSYGPKMEALKRGMDGIERVVKRAKEQEAAKKN